MPVDLKLCKKIPLEKATTPVDGAEVMANRYWVVVDECILLYRGVAPQCNGNKEVADSIQKKLYPDGKVLHLPVVYVDREFRR